jgi:hypothetical protein
MTDWLANNWALLVMALAGAAYFGFYVSMARGRRDQPAGPRRPEKDC